jgi:hypothetical protein
MEGIQIDYQKNSQKPTREKGRQGIGQKSHEINMSLE